MEQLDIHQLISETTEYDKKQALEAKKPKSWCKSVSVFANGIGIIARSPIQDKKKGLPLKPNLC